MEVPISMPDLATTADDVRIVRWLVEVGAAVQRGDPLLEIETDKATMDIDAITSGTLKAVYAAADERVPVGRVIAVIEAAGDAQPVPEATPIIATPATTPPLAVQPMRAEATPGNAPRLSFFARNRLAREATTRRPTTPGASVLTATQLEIGRRMQRSKQTAPHFYLTTSADAERLIALRAAASEQTPPQKVVWDAFFVIAAANALQAFPRMAMQFDGERLTPRPTNAIGVAADVDDALYIIAVEDPLAGSVADVSAQITRGVERLRQGDPAAKKLTPTAFTITNLGAENIESFHAIINPGEAAILAIGKVAPTVQPQGREIVVQHRVSLSLSVDHRVANGKYAAAFLSRIVEEIERF